MIKTPTGNTSTSKLPLNKTHSIAKASAITMAAVLLSRILGLLRDTVISYLFGLNANTDVYRSAFAPADFLFFLIAGGVLSSSFQPVFAKYLSTGEDEEAWKVFSIVASIMTIVVIAMVLITEIFAHPMMHMLRPGMSPIQIDQAASLARIVLPCQICFFLGGLMFSALYSKHNFLTPAIGPIIYNLSIIGCGVIFKELFHLGMEGFAWGALFGAIAGNLILPMFTLRSLNIRFKWSLDWQHPGVKSIGRLMLPIILGLSLPNIYPLINGAFASHLREGSISALDLGNKIMQVPLGVFGQAIGIAVFPTLNTLAALENYKDYRSTFSKTLRLIFFITIPVTVIFMLFASDVVRLLFQYGKFHNASTEITAQTVVYYSIGIFAWSCLAIIQRGFYALHDTKTPIIVSTICTILFIPLCAVFSKLFAHQGLAFATSLGAMIQMAVLLYALNRRLKGLNLTRVLKSFLGTTMAALVMMGAAWVVSLPIRNILGNIAVDQRLISLFILVIAGGLGMSAYFYSAKFLGMSEVKSALDILRRRRPKLI